MIPINKSKYRPELRIETTLAAQRFQVEVLRSDLPFPPRHPVTTKDRSPPAEGRKADDDPEQAGQVGKQTHGDGHYRSSFARDQGCTSAQFCPELLGDVLLVQRPNMQGPTCMAKHA